MAVAAQSLERLPIVLGPSLDPNARGSRDTAGALVSIKYNLKPPSIAKDAPGYMRCPTRNNAEWILEYASSAASAGPSQQGNGDAAAQGFVGSQSQGRNVDCILVWDADRKAYVLDRLASTLSMKYDRNYNKLSRGAQEAFKMIDTRQGANKRRARADSSSPDQGEAQVAESPPDDEEDFARQLEEGLAQVGGNESDVQMEEADLPSLKRAKTGVGLGLVGTSLGQQLEGITPRASPLIDRPSKFSGSAAPAHGMTPTQAAQARTGHTYSPASLTNSPRLTPIQHETSLSSTWKPPAQRAAVAISFDDDEDDDEDDDDDDEDDEEDDEEEEEDDDLEAFARQLEGSLQDSAPATETASGTGRARRASARGTK